MSDQSESPRRPARPALTVIVVVASLLLAAMILLHDRVPEMGGLGLLLDSAAPWLGVALAPLVALATITRSGRRRLVVCVPLAAWILAFGPSIVPLTWTAPAESAVSLTVASQNVQASSGTGAASATALATTGAQIIAIEEMDAVTRREIASVLDPTYEYSYQVGTVGLWSTYPIVSAQPLDLGLGWTRALTADVTTSKGLVSIYVIHAASVRIGKHGDRDEMLTGLADVLSDEKNHSVIAVGDFNAASTDPALAPVLAQVDEPRQSRGMFGFTWPVSPFPLTRLDHFLQRGMEVTSNRVVTAGASDHRAIVATVNL